MAALLPVRSMDANWDWQGSDHVTPGMPGRVPALVMNQDQQIDPWRCIPEGPSGMEVRTLAAVARLEFEICAVPLA